MDNRLKHHRNYNRMNDTRISVFSDLITEKRVDALSIQFQFNIPTLDVDTVTENSGNIYQEDSMANVSSGTDSDSFARLQSRNSIRYRAGREGYLFFTASFTTSDNLVGINGVNQYIGCFNDENGYLLGFKEDRFCVIRLRDGEEFVTYREDFNGDKLDGAGSSELKMNLANLNLFRIRFGWLGASVIIFETMREDGTWIELHRINYPNTEDLPSILTPVIPFNMTVDKFEGEDDIILKTGSVAGGITGDVGDAGNRYFNFSNLKEGLSNGTRHNIFSLRIKEEFFGKENFVDILPVFVSTASDGAGKFVRYIFVLNGNIQGTPDWQDIDEENSVTEYDVDGTTVENGRDIFEFNTGGSDNKTLDLVDFYPLLRAGDTLSLVAITRSNGDVRISLRWRELF